MCGVVQDEKLPRCPRCESLDLAKLMSRFVRGKNDDRRMDEMAAKLDNGALDDDRQLQKFARELGREIESETGETLADEFEELAASERASQSSEPRDDTIY